ncbi:MAG: hypothetical protein Q9218_001390 [Villophora microphyllina]
MATALTANPYPGQSPIFHRVPQHPPSPPIDDFHTKCTLPSIQSLIGVMSESASPEAGPQDPAKSERDSPLPPPPNQSNGKPADVPSHNYGHPPVSSPRASPPSPPLRPDVEFDVSYQSPSATSSHSSAAPAGPYYGSAKNPANVDPQLKQQSAPPASHPGNDSHPPASESPYHNSPYPPSPTNATTYSYPPPNQAATAPPPGYYQRPLPTNFPPPPAPVPMDPALATSPQHQSPIDQTNPWQHQHQHHHYISPSSSAAYSGQSQDRYVCATCSKAFSRPSSLRIHSHSHTGEKPFKCPHPGCGKAFSVRSNMKRHERGCHGGSSPAEA